MASACSQFPLSGLIFLLKSVRTLARTKRLITKTLPDPWEFIYCHPPTPVFPSVFGEVEHPRLPERNTTSPPAGRVLFHQSLPQRPDSSWSKLLPQGTPQEFAAVSLEKHFSSSLAYRMAKRRVRLPGGGWHWMVSGVPLLCTDTPAVLSGERAAMPPRGSQPRASPVGRRVFWQLPGPCCVLTTQMGMLSTTTTGGGQSVPITQM